MEAPGSFPAERPRLHIRPASRADIPALVSVSKTSVSEEEVVGFGTPYSEWIWTDEGTLSAAWQDPNRVRGEEILVAEVDGRVVAYVTLEDRGPDLELVDIEVAREDQGRGIGTRIVGFVEARAWREGRRAVTLGTSRNAEGIAWRSLPWWLSRGYRVTGEEENAWTRSIGPGAREIRMRKDAPSAKDVELRDVLADDLPIFFEQQRDRAANVMAAFTRKDPSDRDDFMAHWGKILADEKVDIKTVLFDGRVAGHILKYESATGPEVSFWIGKEYWGKGIATRALRAFLRQVGARPLYARVAKDNVASIRVLEKSGFRVIGQERGFSNARGHEVEEYVLAWPGNATVTPR